MMWLVEYLECIAASLVLERHSCYFGVLAGDFEECSQSDCWDLSSHYSRMVRVMCLTVQCTWVKERQLVLMELVMESFEVCDNFRQINKVMLVDLLVRVSLGLELRRILRRNC